MLLSGALKCIPRSGNQSSENGLSTLSKIRRIYFKKVANSKIFNPLQIIFQTNEHGPWDIKQNHHSYEMSRRLYTNIEYKIDITWGVKQTEVYENEK